MNPQTFSDGSGAGRGSGDGSASNRGRGRARLLRFQNRVERSGSTSLALANYHDRLEQASQGEDVRDSERDRQRQEGDEHSALNDSVLRLGTRLSQHMRDDVGHAVVGRARNNDDGDAHRSDGDSLHHIREFLLHEPPSRPPRTLLHRIGRAPAGTALIVHGADEAPADHHTAPTPHSRRRLYRRGDDCAIFASAVAYLAALLKQPQPAEVGDLAEKYGVAGLSSPRGIIRDVARLDDQVPPSSFLQPGVSFCGTQRSVTPALRPSTTVGSTSTSRGQYGASLLTDDDDDHDDVVVEPENSWPVTVTLHAVDYDRKTLTGSMEASDLPGPGRNRRRRGPDAGSRGEQRGQKNFRPVTTLFHGQIIDFATHSFETPVPPGRSRRKREREASASQPPHPSAPPQGYVSADDVVFPATGGAAVDAANWCLLPPFCNAAATSADEHYDDGMRSARMIATVRGVAALREEWIFMRWKERCFVHGNGPHGEDACSGGSTRGGAPAMPTRRNDDGDGWTVVQPYEAAAEGDRGRYTGLDQGLNHYPASESHQRDRDDDGDDDIYGHNGGPGLTISGFYYISMRRSDGRVWGLYFDSDATPHQHLELSARWGNAVPAFAFA